jgi:hypothetical protein
MSRRAPPGRKFGVFSDYRRLILSAACAVNEASPRFVMIAFASLRICIFGAAILAAALTSGCTLPDDQALKMVNRGKYSLYDCHAIGRQTRESALRERELATAIEKASRGPGGELIIATVYRPEYLTVKGELQELELMANQKNCRNVLQTQSDGAIQ